METLNHHDKNRPLRTLVIGSLDLEALGANAAGGTVILLRCLVAELQKRPDVELRLIDIGCARDKTGLLKDIGRAMAFFRQVVACIRKVDVVTLHLCSVSSLGLPGLILSRICGKPLLIRKFGGNDYRASRAYCWPWLAEFLLRRTDLYLAETRHLVDEARGRGVAHTEWFPTHRPMNGAANVGREKMVCRRFVYVGQVRQYKGIHELVEAAERLDNGATVDVYGPLFDDLPADLFEGRRRVFYKGFLKHEDVVPTMRQYDAFVLPTKATTEGYPGAILEAYAAGLPVIASACGAIPEIVDETSGLLVEPKDVEALYQAMKRLCEDSDLYERLCRGTGEQAKQFSAQFWAEKFVEYCREIAQKNTDAGFADRGSGKHE